MLKFTIMEDTILRSFQQYLSQTRALGCDNESLCAMESRLRFTVHPSELLGFWQDASRKYYKVFGYTPIFFRV